MGPAPEALPTGDGHAHVLHGGLLGVAILGGELLLEIPQHNEVLFTRVHRVRAVTLPQHVLPQAQ